MSFLIVTPDPTLPPALRVVPAKLEGAREDFLSSLSQPFENTVTSIPLAHLPFLQKDKCREMKRHFYGKGDRKSVKKTVSQRQTTRKANK